jgi:hypothetical protein
VSRKSTITDNQIRNFQLFKRLILSDENNCRSYPVPHRESPKRVARATFIVLVLNLLAGDAMGHEVNWADPNLQTDRAKSTQCQFSHKVFCYPVPEQTKKDVEEQQRLEDEMRTSERRQLLNAQRAEKRDQCKARCDAWFRPANLPTPNAQCRAACDWSKAIEARGFVDLLSWYFSQRSLYPEQ